MKFWKKTAPAILTVMGLSLLSGCAKDIETQAEVRVIDRTGVVCSVLKGPINKHMNSIIDHGEGIIGIGADEVIVTGTEVSDAYDKSC